MLQTALCDLEMRFREAIERATVTDGIAASVDPVHTARALLGLYLGLCVLVRSGWRTRSRAARRRPSGADNAASRDAMSDDRHHRDALIDIGFDTDW